MFLQAWGETRTFTLIDAGPTRRNKHPQPTNYQSARSPITAKSQAEFLIDLPDRQFFQRERAP